MISPYKYEINSKGKLVRKLRPKCENCGSRKYTSFLKSYDGEGSYSMCDICNPKLRIKSSECTTSEIKEQRKEYFNSALQPFRSGELSREFVETYPTKVKKMVKSGYITPEEVNKSKYVWKDLDGWDNRHKSK